MGAGSTVDRGHGDFVSNRGDDWDSESSSERKNSIIFSTRLIVLGKHLLNLSPDRKLELFYTPD